MQYASYSQDTVLAIKTHTYIQKMQIKIKIYTDTDIYIYYYTRTFYLALSSKLTYNTYLIDKQKLEIHQHTHQHTYTESKREEEWWNSHSAAQKFAYNKRYTLSISKVKSKMETFIVKITNKKTRDEKTKCKCDTKLL